MDENQKVFWKFSNPRYSRGGIDVIIHDLHWNNTRTRNEHVRAHTVINP